MAGLTKGKLLLLKGIQCDTSFVRIPISSLASQKAFLKFSASSLGGLLFNFMGSKGERSEKSLCPVPV